MKMNEFTPEQQETIKKELDPKNPNGLLSKLIDAIEDTWHYDTYIIPGELQSLYDNFTKFEQYSWDDGFYSPVVDDWDASVKEEEEYSSQLYLKNVCLEDEDGDEYFNFYEDVCDVNQAILDTVKLKRNSYTHQPRLVFDINKAIETIEAEVKLFLEEK